MTADPHTPGAETPPPARSGLLARAARHVAAAARARLAAAAGAAASAWDLRPRGLRAAAVAFAAALAAAGTWGTIFQATLARRLPRALDWEAAAALLDRDAVPGDAVVPSPPWAERARLALPGRVPVLDPPEPGEPLLGVKRTWLVALPDAPGFSWAPELALLEIGARAGPAAILGGLEVSRTDVAVPALALAFLPDRLAQAQVSLGDAPCAPEAPGVFACPGPGAVRVERTVRQVGGRARPCLLAPPDAAAGVPLTVTFPSVAIGRTLRGHAGVAGDPPGAGEVPVRISVQLDGEEAGAAELTGPGWRPFRIDTSRFAGRGRTLSLVVTASAPAGPLCLDAETLP